MWCSRNRSRNPIEQASNKLKQWRRRATRYDRGNPYFLSALHLVADMVWGNQLSIGPNTTVAD